MNRLISKGMSNIYLKFTIEKNWHSQNINFKKIFSRSVFGVLQLMKISLNFKTSCCNVKSRSLEEKLAISLAAFLEPLVHRWNITNLSLFYGYYFSRCLSKLAQLVALPCYRRGSTRYSDGFHDFSLTISWCYNDAYVNSFFPAQLDYGILCL